MSRTIESLLPVETVCKLVDYTKEQEIKNEMYEYICRSIPNIFCVTTKNEHGSLATVMYVYLSACETLVGAATCHPNDRFNVVFGERLALKRALAPLPRRLRSHVWKCYLSEKSVSRQNLSRE